MGRLLFGFMMSSPPTVSDAVVDPTGSVTLTIACQGANVNSTNSNPASSGAGITGDALTISVADQLALAQARLLKLQQDKEVLAKQTELQSVLAQCAALEAENALAATGGGGTSQITSRYQGSPVSLPAVYPSAPSTTVNAAAMGLLNLASTSLPQAIMSTGHHVPPPLVDSAALRQMSAIQAGTDDYMRRLGLLRGDPAMSEDGFGNTDARTMPQSAQLRTINAPVIKSGKLATITSRVVVAEKWPHSFLGRQFVGANKQYEDLTIAEFCAGFTGILKEESSASVLAFRLSHLEHLMYFATIYTWSSVLKLHAAVLVEIEKGIRKWGDDTRHLEATTLVPARQDSRHNSKGKGSNRGTQRILFCAAFQNGSCQHSQDHEGMLGGRQAFLRHVCAKCLQSYGTAQPHGDKSSACPLNNSSNPPSSTSSAATPVSH